MQGVSLISLVFNKVKRMLRVNFLGGSRNGRNNNREKGVVLRNDYIRQVVL